MAPTSPDESPLDEADVEALRRTLADRPVTLAVAFGSRVRGTDLPWSDLDVGVRFHRRVDRDERLRLLDALTADLEAALEAGDVDLVDLDRIGPDRAYQAMREGVLLVGDEGNAIEVEAQLLLEKLDFQPVKEAWQAGLSDRIEEGRYGRA